MIGLCRLGHDVYYFETSSAWPYDPIRNSRVNVSEYAVSYLAQVANHFGFGSRWAYRRSYGDKAWFGLSRTKAEELLAHADVIMSITGSTRLAEEGLKVGRLVYVCTDPVVHECRYASGDEDIRTLVDEHDDVVTFGENIGTARCDLVPLPALRARTRQPVVLDHWKNGPPSRTKFTTVGNWRQAGRDSEYRGETYYWSKHREYLKFIELPRRTPQPVELATGLIRLHSGDRALLRDNGWRLTDSHAFTLTSYRDYIRFSRGEFTVAKDANVRLSTGWFSDRSACYLAAGRPVITQDTGFDTVLPIGEGLFAFKTMEDILNAIEAINSDYKKHSRAAQAIAEEYFRAETVLAQLLRDLGF
jgi:glycosyltransferase involved in cell wall biosynthesis